ncbi:MAG: DUF177 domain-containing protein [Chloroflexota bacterium]|nr:DUF177 domain-containing protein [Chloroflexota bacterium]
MTAEGTAAGGAAVSAVRYTTSLLFNVSTLLQEPIGSVRRYEVTDARGNGLHSDVSGALRLLRTDHSILATAELSTVVADLCGGCLCEMTLPLALSFDEEFWPPAEAASDEYLQPPQEQIGFSVIDGQLDLSEAVRQYVEMGRPMSPRCGQDCPGLETESTSEAPVDDRWSALAALQQKLQQEIERD